VLAKTGVKLLKEAASKLPFCPTFQAWSGINLLRFCQGQLSDLSQFMGPSFQLPADCWS